MSLENILEAVEEEGRRQVAGIEESARFEIERIQTQAQQEADAVRRRQLEAIQGPLQAERARLLNQARLEAVRIVMGSRQALIASALAAAGRRLEALPDTESYPPVLRRLALESAAALGGESGLRLRVVNRDLDLMNRIAREEGLAAVIEGGLQAAGGLVATSPDGRIRVVNTLEERLRQAARLHPRRIAEILFGPQGKPESGSRSGAARTGAPGD